MTPPRYRTFSAWAREHFASKARKITLDAGLTCPHRDSRGRGGCIYCNDRGSGTGAHARGLSVADQLELGIRRLSSPGRKTVFIAYFQSFTNTYAPPETLSSIYDEVLSFPEVAGLSIGTRPDCIDEEKLGLIAGYTDRLTVWVEYGLQSASDETLRLINRGHDVKTFVDAVELTSRFGLRICAHAIIGLPGEGMDHYLKTARLLSLLPVTDVKIHLLYVVKGTPLEDLFRRGAYRPLEPAEYAEAVARFIGNLREDIVIQRITGDPHPSELVSPSWALDKAMVRSIVHETMDRLGILQGSLRG
ncbi:MAG TPA: TIGR01212 family radical SAM protein [Deltaproteobacteria bacterium]|nr:TIGR01212 family radical SAM protein [Deltaproteobacteria bacterium]HOM30152.1 TIGR01212 family radical SAM protein [Deltaproteobacteria bacterium]HPP80360.1 TIGR01212 family radical SAM protein [Deltaproteobacteria bacterium]